MEYPIIDLTMEILVLYIYIYYIRKNYFIT